MLDWLENFKIATSKQICFLFYDSNINICNKRLLKLTKDKVLHRTSDPYSLQYIYSLKPIKTTYQIRHYYIRNDFYIELIKLGCEITSYRVEKQLGSVIPDLSIQFNFKCKHYMYFVEVERSENRINVEKYNRFFMGEYEEYITTPIIVVYVTHKTIPQNTYKHIKVQLDLSDIKKIL